MRKYRLFSIAGLLPGNARQSLCGQRALVRSDRSLSIQRIARSIAGQDFQDVVVGSQVLAAPGDAGQDSDPRLRLPGLTSIIHSAPGSIGLIAVCWQSLACLIDCVRFAQEVLKKNIDPANLPTVSCCGAFSCSLSRLAVTVARRHVCLRRRYNSCVESMQSANRSIDSLVRFSILFSLCSSFLSHHLRCSRCCCRLCG